MLIRLSLTMIAVILTALPAAAQSRPAIAYTTANLNMRAGPGTNYPVIITVPRGGGVTIFGCTPDYKWCDAAFTNAKGWVSGKYLNYGGDGGYYGQPIPNSGVYIGVPRYQRNYPDYRRPPVVVQPVRPAPYRPRYPGYPPRYFEHQVY